MPISSHFCFDFSTYAVELVATTSVENYPMFSVIGQVFRYCEFNFLPSFYIFAKHSKCVNNFVHCVFDREIQGSGFEGPIPSSISMLNNLTQL